MHVVKVLSYQSKYAKWDAPNQCIPFLIVTRLSRCFIEPAVQNTEED